MGRRIAVGRVASSTLAMGMIGVLVAALVALSSDEVTSMTAQQPTAGVWVVNEATGMLGRADIDAGTIEPAVAMGAAHVELVQSSNTALVIDRARGVATTLDAATFDRSAEMTLPAPDVQIVLAMVSSSADPDPGLDAALLSPRDGDVWIVPVKDLAGFEPHSAPAFSFGAGASLAVGDGGALFAASPRDGALYEVSFDGAERRGEFEPFRATAAHPAQTSVSAAHWSVLDPLSKRLLTDSGAVDLGALGVGSELALEVALSPTRIGTSAAPAVLEASGSVFVATGAELIEASVDAVRSRVRADAGSPARPWRLGDCVYAAWDADTRAIGCDDDVSRLRAASAAAMAWTPASGLRPELRTDGSIVVANYAATGESWAVTAGGGVPLTWESDASFETLGLSVPVTKEGAGDETAPPGGRAEAPHAEEPDEVPSVEPHAEREKHAPTAPEPEAAAPGALTAGRVEATPDRADGTIAVSWDPFVSEGPAVAGYLVQRLAPGDEPGECVVENGAASVIGGDVQSAKGTTTLFGGAAPPAGGYRFVVWGYTDAQCAAAEPIEVLPEPTPAAVTDPRGGMTWIGTRYDYGIAPGDAARYEVQRVDAAGSPTGPVGVFSKSAVPRELTEGRFGEVLRYRLRACTVWGADAACGPWAEHAAPEPSLDFTLVDLAYSEEKSEWTWSALPDNGTVRLRINGVGGDGTHWETGANYSRASQAVSSGQAALGLRLGATSLTIPAS